MLDFRGKNALPGSDGRRRLWPADLKRQILAESFEPGASVAMVARRHGVNANLLFTWRRRFGAARSAKPAEAVNVVPVAIAAENSPAVLQPASGSGGRMEIVLSAGARVIVGTDVEVAALARVIKVLDRR